MTVHTYGRTIAPYDAGGYPCVGNNHRRLYSFLDTESAIANRNRAAIVATSGGAHHERCNPDMPSDQQTVVSPLNHLEPALAVAPGLPETSSHVVLTLRASVSGADDSFRALRPDSAFIYRLSSWYRARYAVIS